MAHRAAAPALKQGAAKRRGPAVRKTRGLCRALTGAQPRWLSDSGSTAALGRAGRHLRQALGPAQGGADHQPQQDLGGLRRRWATRHRPRRGAVVGDALSPWAGGSAGTGDRARGHRRRPGAVGRQPRPRGQGLRRQFAGTRRRARPHRFTLHRRPALLPPDALLLHLRPKRPGSPPQPRETRTRATSSASWVPGRSVRSRGRTIGVTPSAWIASSSIGTRPPSVLVPWVPTST